MIMISGNDQIMGMGVWLRLRGAVKGATIPYSGLRLAAWLSTRVGVMDSDERRESRDVLRRWNWLLVVGEDA